MDINNSAISTQVAQSISKLNLNTATRAFNASKNDENKEVVQDFRQEDTALVDEDTVRKNAQNIDVQDIQKYADIMGETLSIEDINYGLMYGRSVLADYSV